MLATLIAATRMCAMRACSFLLFTIYFSFFFGGRCAQYDFVRSTHLGNRY
jgi:hypothetical protein